MREETVNQGNRSAQGRVDSAAEMADLQIQTADGSSEVIRLSQEIIEDARSRILMEERYLDHGLYALKPAAASGSQTEDYAIDGQKFYFSPEHVLQEFREEENRVCRAWMHALLHSIFLHPFTGAGLQIPALWDLSCDIAVEGIILSQKKSCFRLEKDEAQRKVIQKLQDQVGLLTAERLFSYFAHHPVRSEQRRELAELFHSDTHTLWKELAVQKIPAQENVNRNGDNGAAVTPEESGKADQTLLGRRRNAAYADLRDAYSPVFSGSYSGDLKQIWARRSGYLLSEMRSGSRGRTEEAGWLMQELSEMQRKPVDYRKFLRKFMTDALSARPCTDEFNSILYTYGLQLYGNLPLIEEAETSRRKKISDFIIAIDTSGSTAGSLVRGFLRQTCGILMDKEIFSDQMNLHILQCDAKIQEVCVIRHKSEIDRVVKNMNIRGFGGTDFRPVFAYADQAVRSGELQHLQGILYFTDGRGTYPKKRPPCRTAFIFLRREQDMPEVPPWAYSVIWEHQL